MPRPSLFHYDGRAALAVLVMNGESRDIKQLIRLARAFPAMTSLRYIHHRLASTTFEETMDAVLEHEMLTLAFVVAYARLVDGSSGSGVARQAIPLELRPAHDEIIGLRNKRFAHNDGHESLKGGLGFEFSANRVDVKMSFGMDYYIGGAQGWGKLVVFLDELMVERLKKQLKN